jgi:hypothetical protein
MAMNFAPLDYPCQGASSEPTKIYLDFFVLEKFAKKPKNTYFWLPQQKMGSMAGTFTIPGNEFCTIGLLLSRRFF